MLRMPLRGDGHVQGTWVALAPKAAGDKVCFFACATCQTPRVDASDHRCACKHAMHSVGAQAFLTAQRVMKDVDSSPLTLFMLLPQQI